MTMATWLTAFALIFLRLVEHSSTIEQKPLSSDFNKSSADNSTANLVVSTASSLLQSQAIPNSRYRNGHTIIPGIVQPGTMLYHGRADSDIPAMYWVAFEPELSYTFCQIFGGAEDSPSLIAVRSGKPRLAHRLLGIDEDDIVRVRKYLEEQIAETPWFSLQFEAVEHVIDWHAYLHSIISLYGKPLKDIWVIINSTWPQYDVQPNNQDSQVKTAFRLIEYTVQRFILYSVGTLPILLGLLPFTKNVHCPTLRPSQPRHVQSRKLFYVRRWKERRANYAEF
ncbi:hypothetical protein EV359DRAFT_83431 [Lentinula novae-zelandiae]|nr:hypothetical protein EV359DRAFT_83431 [Lentinula novae-zelandiae]